MNASSIVRYYKPFVISASIKTTHCVNSGFEWILCAVSSAIDIYNETYLSLEQRVYDGDYGCLKYIVNTDSPFTMFTKNGFMMIQHNTHHSVKGSLLHMGGFIASLMLDIVLFTMDFSPPHDQSNFIKWILIFLEFIFNTKITVMPSHTIYKLVAVLLLSERNALNCELLFYSTVPSGWIQFIPFFYQVNNVIGMSTPWLWLVLPN